MRILWGNQRMNSLFNRSLYQEPWYRQVWYRMHWWIINPVRDTYYRVKWYFRNIWKFRRSLSYYRNWDSVCIEQVMSEMYMDIADHIESHGWIVGAEDIAKKARVISLLLRNREPSRSRRMEELIDESIRSHFFKEVIEDGRKMYEMGDRMDSNRRKTLTLWYERDQRSEEYRWEYLMKMITKYHRSIWD